MISRLHLFEKLHLRLFDNQVELTFQTKEVSNSVSVEKVIICDYVCGTPFENAKRWLDKIHSKFCFKMMPSFCTFKWCDEENSKKVVILVPI